MKQNKPGFQSKSDGLYFLKKKKNKPFRGSFSGAAIWTQTSKRQHIPVNPGIGEPKILLFPSTLRSAV